MIESFSQCGQDLFAYSLLGDSGTYLDLGCYLPKKINNTYLLELKGWAGVSIDIIDYTNEWKCRKNKFICDDCFNIDYKSLLKQNYSSTTIDYLSLDMEKIGERYKLLTNILNSGYDFKVITIEHDSYLGKEYVENEKMPQREILNNYGYILLCGDVSQQQNPTLYYEDWWVNPKYFDMEKLKVWKSNMISCDIIFNNVNIRYTVNEESKRW